MKVTEAIKQRFNEESSNQETEEVVYNLVGFFEVLIEIDRDLKLNKQSNEF